MELAGHEGQCRLHRAGGLLLGDQNTAWAFGSTAALACVLERQELHFDSDPRARVVANLELIITVVNIRTCINHLAPLCMHAKLPSQDGER